MTDPARRTAHPRTFGVAIRRLLAATRALKQLTALISSFIDSSVFVPCSDV